MCNEKSLKLDKNYHSRKISNFPNFFPITIGKTNFCTKNGANHFNFFHMSTLQNNELQKKANRLN